MDIVIGEEDVGRLVIEVRTITVMMGMCISNSLIALFMGIDRHLFE